MTESIIFTLIVFICAVAGSAIWFACIDYLTRGVDDAECKFKMALTTLLTVVPCLALTLIGFGRFLVWIFLPSRGVSVPDFLIPFSIGVLVSIFSYSIWSELIRRP